jgi:hypothetical protein
LRLKRPRDPRYVPERRRPSEVPASAAHRRRVMARQWRCRSALRQGLDGRYRGRRAGSVIGRGDRARSAQRRAICRPPERACRMRRGGSAVALHGSERRPIGALTVAFACQLASWPEPIPLDSPSSGPALNEWLPRSAPSCGGHTAAASASRPPQSGRMSADNTGQSETART